MRANTPIALDSDPNGLKSVFGQMFLGLKRHMGTLIGVENMQLWNVQFEGEGSIDAGGPYRESVTLACMDLLSSAVPLFVPCPNARNDVGLNREKYIIKASSVSAIHIEMYEFVGFLIASALRTKMPLSLDLPSIFWKQILGDEVSLSDLEEIDKLSVQAYTEMKAMDVSKFEELVSEKFIVQLSDQTEVELKENGKEIPVTFQDRDEFVKLAIQKRLNESSKQIAAIKKGIDAIIPLRMLSLFSWYDLQVMVCGNPFIDLEVLKKHTKYEGLSQSAPVVKYFWSTLESFNMEERQLFLRFVWGRNRLPNSERGWNQEFTVNGLMTSDEMLPIAHTCFFSLDLPQYSSFEICRSKIHYAIYNCTAIDVDFNPASSTLNAWLED
jgi:E3 ubiquitin-protein ligase HERC2